MSQTAVKVEGLSKKYTIRHEARAHYQTLRESLMQAGRRLFRRSAGPAESRATREEFWALRYVSFEIPRGEVVGIIGRNGAGKSTLLKLLSRITEPTAGCIKLNGRVASLLEVGTGFHQELTGRENIFLNGAVLGMGRAEIKRKFDEIVAFAETEKFLDTPVKHYSSGMYMRLAFAVAAHLEPEILVVDEVLAVGDLEFQNKCMGKMREVSKGGRTVLFVSHNLTAVASLCDSGLLLSAGRLVFCGAIGDAINAYRKPTIEVGNRPKTGRILKRVQLISAREHPEHSGFIFDFNFDVEPTEDRLGLDIVIRHQNYPVCFAASYYYSGVVMDRKTRRITFTLGPINFATGVYEMDVYVCRPAVAWIEENIGAFQFEVERQHIPGNSYDMPAKRLLGFIIPNQTWSVEI